MNVPKGIRVVVLGGGVSSERTISLASSRAVFDAVRKFAPASWVDVTGRQLPVGLDPEHDVIFPVLHGSFGEDGAIQELLEGAGFVYAGCDARASALCMDKVRTKEVAEQAGVPVAPHCVFISDGVPAWEDVVQTVRSENLVLKPRAEGSSVGLHFIASENTWREQTRSLGVGEWMVEPLITGNDYTVGLLEGAALGVVGIFPDGGHYDYEHKYTAGRTRYEVPAQLSPAITDALRDAAARLFQALGARDFARADFLLQGEHFTLLEMNTIPGLTATSLLPKSASVCGLDFVPLVQRMLRPAFRRHLQRFASHV